MTEITRIEEELLDEIELFLTDHHISVSAFGQEACGDHKIIRKLQQGKRITSKTINSIRNYIAENQ